MESVKRIPYDAVKKNNENVKTQATRIIASTENKIITESIELRSILSAIKKRIAKKDVNVLITGETGVGKNLVADFIHQHSGRKKNNFVYVNCASLAEGIIESELFGHAKGAFTGAVNTKVGVFSLANGGTIFLDEIGELSLEAQGKLLQVIQEKKFRIVGSNKAKDENVDIRIIAATNRNIPAMIKEKKFKADLFSRLNVIGIRIPPLRERSEDISILVSHFLEELREQDGLDYVLSKKVLGFMRKYSWPDNVRGIKNALQRAVVFCEEGIIKIKDLGLSSVAEDANLFSFNKFLTLEEAEKFLIVRAYENTDGTALSVAKLLGISRRALYYKLNKYGLN